ncbi:MAG: alanine racemase [Nitrospirae bacterium]|nr:alanine racemase [Nitrospirota bacterium]
MNRGAVAEVNLTAIAHNFKILRDIVGKRPVIAVVKADAYGHGAIEVSKRLIQEGVSCLAVAFTDEAIQLRNAGINAPIIVLFDTKDLEDFFNFNLIPVIHDVSIALAISRKATEKRKKINVHVKVDTGMGRIGLSGNKIIDNLICISEMEGLEITGIMSHFSEADLLDRSFAYSQLKEFNRIREELFKKLKKRIFSHIANSAAVLTFGESHLDAVRPGLMLYGYSSLSKDSELNLIPAMKVKTVILCIRNLPSGFPISYGRTFITKRQSIIGVIPVGYADGYNRLFSNNAEVLVKGVRVPVVGRVCMDLTMIDLTDIKDVKEGEEVVLLGQQGNETITAYELANKAGTIPYEILTSFGRYSKKEYVN